MTGWTQVIGNNAAWHSLGPHESEEGRYDTPRCDEVTNRGWIRQRSLDRRGGPDGMRTTERLS